jgi:hypothetical protein
MAIYRSEIYRPFMMYTKLMIAAKTIDSSEMNARITPGRVTNPIIPMQTRAALRKKTMPMNNMQPD